MKRPAAAALAALTLCLLLSAGCSRRKKNPTPDPAPMHPSVTPFDFGWIRDGFEEHPYLILKSIEQREHHLPGKAVAEVRLRQLQPEGMVRSEIGRIHRVYVEADQRMKAITYVVRGLGDTEWGVLVGNWGRGGLLRWSHPDGP